MQVPAEQFPEGVPSAPGSAAQAMRPGGEPMGPEEIAANANALLAARAAEEGGNPTEEDLMRASQQRPERPRTAGRRPPKVTSKVKESSEQTAGPTTLAAPTIIA